MLELDGVARRIILWPPDLPLEHLSYVMSAAEVDCIISDHAMIASGSHGRMCYWPCSRNLISVAAKEGPVQETEWILMTSGTTGRPKLVAHTLASLTAAIQPRLNRDEEVIWGTFYDIRRYGGLQILLRAALTGASLVLSSKEEPLADFLTRLARAGVTHISGTPSHWRRALMSPSVTLLNPKYIRLSGEAPDQGILNRLRSTFPAARIVHAFASTEAGVAFEVNDELAGFPASALNENPLIDMKVEDGTLRIRSAGNSKGYIGPDAPVLKDQAGYVDAGDRVELRDGRYYFAGRRDGVINVGGLKVHPEEVESVIQRHPEVQACLVHAKKSPITGALVVANVVPSRSSMPSDGEMHRLERDILQLCRETLPPHKVPAAIKLVSELPITESGKVMRQYA
ncbi:ANL family adenylate-forming protein [Occallatibacter riparius]|uniref:Long-chain-fatty-acid--CoA ligase n=1 Tax=Occallatibacter riparius TaxID=1002689 RepID=A0A9J7BS19_9BACT|nr:fatty acid--CoA ligase family protein [Occallatibacter riparius]UWZ83710.1 fatty acid--CoA ligase family protein [Occallatibacter riparius]